MHVYVWKEIVNMSIGWAPDMIGWVCAQPFPTLATPLMQSWGSYFIKVIGYILLVTFINK